MLITKDLQNMLKKIKNHLQKLRTQLTEKEVSAWVQWVFMRISNAKASLLKGFSQLALITKPSNISKEMLWKQVKTLPRYVGKLLIYMVAVCGTLICWLLLLMPVAVLYVVALPLVLNHIVLTYIHTKLYQVRTKLRTKILKIFSEEKV